MTIFNRYFDSNGDSTLSGNVNIDSKTLNECKAYIERGEMDTQSVSKLIKGLYAIGYINPQQCDIHKMPEEYQPIKLESMWLRRNFGDENMKITGTRGLVQIDPANIGLAVKAAPVSKLDADRLFPSCSLSSEDENWHQSAQIASRVPWAIINALNMNQNRGVILAGGAVYCAIYKYVIKDYDFFLYGFSEQEFLKTVNGLASVIPNVYSVTHTRYAITAKTMDGTAFQFILRRYRSINQILYGFDNDACQLAYDGEKLYATPGALYALRNHVNVVDLDIAGSAYENRLIKYFNRGIGLFLPSFDKNRLDSIKLALRRAAGKNDAKGFSRLILGITGQIHLPADKIEDYVPGKKHGGYWTMEGERVHSWKIHSGTIHNASLLWKDDEGGLIGVVYVNCPVRPVPGWETKLIGIDDSFCGAFNPVGYKSTEEWYVGELYN